MSKLIKKVIVLVVISMLYDSIYVYAGGFKYVGGELYWHNDDGSIAIGFIFDGDKVYYADDTGKIVRATESGTYRFVYDNHYQGQFYVDDKGIVSMNETSEPHWKKVGNNWFHCGTNGVIDKNRWIVDEENRKIYRVDHEGRLCHGWAADSDTHMTYYFDTNPDSGALLCDSFGTPYDDIYNLIASIVNLDGKYSNNLYNAPVKEKNQY